MALSAGEKIDRFTNGLNPALKRLVVTAPVGTYGRWMDPVKIMDYTVMQAQALLGGGDVGLDATSSAVRGSKRGLDDQGKHIYKKPKHGNVKKGKAKQGNGGGSNGYQSFSFCDAAQKQWLAVNCP